jgi:hypothetical protein
MRTGMTRARDEGVNLALLGSTAGFRQIRFQPSPTGLDRRMVNYRIARNDPLFGRDNDRVTVDWRSAPVRMPESEMNGVAYRCHIFSRYDMVIANASSWLFAGTSLHDGDHLRDVVGNEYDAVWPNLPTPSSLEILARSPTVCAGRPDFADATYYTAGSGAGVFASGTYTWTVALGVDCALGTECTGASSTVLQVTRNLLVGFAGGPSGRDHPSRTNLGKFGIRLRKPLSTP